MGLTDLETGGAVGYHTPNLNKLALNGQRLTRFYTPQAICSASRAALLTGCYPNRVGIYGALTPKEEIGLDSGETTIAAVLKSVGYATQPVGKWHLGHLPEFLPTRPGLDRKSTRLNSTH